jgi:hypothetical protein
VIANALLPPLQGLIDTDEFYGTAMIAGERARLETIELINRLEFNACAATIAFEMAGANIVVAVPAMRHLKTSVGHWRPSGDHEDERANREILERGLKYESSIRRFQTIYLILIACNDS